MHQNGRSQLQNAQFPASTLNGTQALKNILTVEVPTAITLIFSLGNRLLPTSIDLDSEQVILLFKVTVTRKLTLLAAAGLVQRIR